MGRKKENKQFCTWPEDLLAIRWGVQEPRGDRLALCFQDRKPELLAEERLTLCIQQAMVEMGPCHPLFIPVA